MSYYKYILFFLALTTLNACHNVKSNHADTNVITSADFGWLVGEWQRINDMDEKRTFESWSKISNTHYSGEGFTLSGVDTVFKENIELVTNGESWLLNVSQGREPKVRFVLTHIDSLSFISENPKNAFPKRIEYKRLGHNLEAIIAADSTSISFKFMPLGTY